MDTGVVQYETKFKKLLEKFLEPDFRIRNDVYLNTLLSHLSGKHDKELSDALLDLPLFTEWIIQACTYWENSTKKPAQTVSVFALHLVSLLSRDEKKFAYFKTYNVYNTLCTLLKVRCPESSPSTKLAYIKMLSSFLIHKSGIDWLISTDYWRDGLNYCLENQTVYIVREGHKFMSDLLKQSMDCNEIFCNLVVKQVVMKLSDFPCQNGTVYPEVREEMLQKHVTPILRLICYILENYLQSDLCKNNDFRIPTIIIKNYQLESYVWKINMMANNPEFVYDLDKVFICMYFLQTLLSSREDLVPRDETKRLGTNMLKVLNIRMNKNAVYNVLKFCHYTDYLWQYFQSRLPTPTNEASLFRLENHLVPIEVLPLISVTIKHCISAMKDYETDDLRDDYVSKLFKSMSEQTTRLAFQWRKVLMNQDDVFGIAQQALSYIMNSRKFYPRSRAVLVFQSCIYTFKDITRAIKEDASKSEVFVQNSNFSVSLINTLSTFINENNITWRESVETICVLSVTIEFLNLKIWPPRTMSPIFSNMLQSYKVRFIATIPILVAKVLTFYSSTIPIPVQLLLRSFGTVEHVEAMVGENSNMKSVVVEALKLLNLSITKYMSPNLALLVDQTHDSALDMIGPLLCTKLHDVNWEVRDSSLEILNTISAIACTKFPSFQKIILDSNLIILVVMMSVSDSESFVRASAIKCLQEMIKVSEFWNPFLMQQELPQKMMHVLHNESEAIVRTEAACLMRCIYEHQAFPEEIMEPVYACMAHATTADLHWEVKVNAVDFWGKVFLNHLQNQGMIDGRFPDVTFSREHKKIVTLTETEIKYRLSKVLNQLSRCGCLGVLISAMEDECDLEVTKKAVSKGKKIAALFEQYNFKTVCSGANSPSPPSSRNSFSPIYPRTYPSPSLICNPMNTPPCTPKVDYADDVIDQIINSTDINLLTDVYSPNHSMTPSNSTGSSSRNFKSVSPEIFLDFIQKDLDSIVNAKTKWLNNIDDLNSLLDDMLKSYNSEDINSMDCY